MSDASEHMRALRRQATDRCPIGGHLFPSSRTAAWALERLEQLEKLEQATAGEGPAPQPLKQWRLCSYTVVAAAQQPDAQKLCFELEMNMVKSLPKGVGMGPVTVWFQELKP